MPERKLVYENLKHKANAGFLVKAPSLERLFIDSALALTDQRVSLDRVTDTEKRTLHVKADSREALMVSWLNEILGLYRIDKFLTKRITFQKFDGKQIQATLFGEFYAPLRHGSISDIPMLTAKGLQMGELHEQELSFFAKLILVA